MPKTKDLDIHQMLAYCRPAWSDTEVAFITRYIDTLDGVQADNYGNRLVLNPTSRVLIACHTDTVHRKNGYQRIVVKGGIARLPEVPAAKPAAPRAAILTTIPPTSPNCLGADDTAGVYAALRMLSAGVKVNYIFHRAEEIGGKGSQFLASTYPEWLERNFDICLSLDRRGTNDVITHQWAGRTASDEFAWSLALALDMDHVPSDGGSFTDSANYAELIPECSNLAIGYAHEHTSAETLDLNYLEKVVQRLIAVAWEELTVARDPTAYYDPWEEWREPANNEDSFWDTQDDRDLPLDARLG